MLNYSDITKVTIDYMFRDTDRIGDLMMLVIEDGDSEALGILEQQCRERSLDLDKLLNDAVNRRLDMIQKFCTGNVAPGPPIRVPFQYKQGGTI